MNRKAIILLFSIILLIAIFLRLYKMNDLPPSLNWDEVSLGYNAYSILKTAKDEWGQFLPLSFRAFGDYKLPFYIYLDIPFVAIFGLNELAVRLPSFLAGIGTVLLIFFITKELTKSAYLSLWGMFISAVVPWLVTFSRIALEANVALFLTTASFYSFLISLRKSIFLPVSAFLLGLSVFTYNSSRVLILPFIILAVISFHSVLKRNKQSLATILILLVFICVALFQAITVDSGARYRWITILDEGAIVNINQLRGSSKLPKLFSELVYNKPTFFISTAFKNYFSLFDPIFLFSKGGSNFQFSVPGSGHLYWVMLPFILFGLWQMVKQRKDWQLFILGWMIISPIPGAITRDSPHFLRTIFLVIPLIIASVVGVKWIKESISPKIFHSVSVLVILIFFASTFLFWQGYNGEYRRNYSWSWQYGYKQVVEFIKHNQDKYDSIVLTKKYGEPHEFVLFFLKYEPKIYQNNTNLVRYQRSDWFWVDKFDKFQFINDWEIKEKTANMKNTLLVTSPDNYPEGSHLLETINFLDGKKAFEIVKLD